MRKIVIFGAGDMGQLTLLLLREDGRREVAAFTVERSHLAAAQPCELELVPFEEVAKSHPPATHDILIALGPGERNRHRKRLFEAAAGMGYEFASYVHPSARVHAASSMGRNCLIYENAVVQPYARLADNVTVRPLSYIGHHVSLGAHSFVAPNASLLGRCSTGERCFIAAGAVVGPGIGLGAGTVVGANASVLGPQADDSFVPPCTVAR